MHKIVHPFDTLIGSRYAPVFIEIEIKSTSKSGERLTIHGVEGPLKSGNCRGGCGQIDMHMDDGYLSQVRFQKGWDRKMVDDLLGIWKRWHLNDMHSGCAHQRELERGANKVGDKCLVCDHAYGTRWVHEPIPDDVYQALANFPESKRMPAWV